MSWAPALLLSLLSLTAAQNLRPTEDCPILGPTFPSSFDIESTRAFQNAVAAFPQRMEALFEAGVINKTHSSVSVDIFSSVTNRTIYSYYHAAPGLNHTLSQGVLNDETIQRIGSVSKLFTVYAIIAKAGLGILNDPITKYVPELAGNPKNDPLGRIYFEDVTVEALASQIGGTGGFTLEAVACTNNTSPPLCTIEGYLAGVRKLAPVTPVFGTALYSDQGFGILGRVLERITGLTYDQAIKSVLGEPLGLNSTSAVVPTGDDVNGVIFPGTPGVDTAWGYDNVLLSGSGGVYSTLGDLRRLGLSILHSELLDSASTRLWLKPRSFTSALTVALGAPWEINRLPIPVSPGSNRTRVSDIYTKSGGQPSFGTAFGLSPDHGIGFSAIVASDLRERALAERWPLRDVVGETFVTAAEHAGMENAAQNYAGTFVSSSIPNTNVTITVDADKPGIGIESLFFNGTESRGEIFSIGGTGIAPPANISVRVYPSGVESAEGGVNGTRHLAFRAIPATIPVTRSRAAVEGGRTMFENACLNWFTVDFASGLIGEYGIDEFIFKVVAGRLESVSYRANNITMERVD